MTGSLWERRAMVTRPGGASARGGVREGRTSNQNRAIAEGAQCGAGAIGGPGREWLAWGGGVPHPPQGSSPDSTPDSTPKAFPYPFTPPNRISNRQ